MAEDKPHIPFGEMMALWQKMMWEGFEMMMKTSAFGATLGKAFEGPTAVQEQIQKSMQAGLKAMNVPTTEDLRRITDGVAAMQAQLEAMKQYLGVLERGVKLQEEWRKNVDETIARLMTYQQEGQKAFQDWTKQVEDRVQGLQGLWEEGAKRWAEGLQQAVEILKVSQRTPR